MRTCFVLLALLLATVAAFAKVTLVQDGKPAAKIVIADKPTENAKVAANELQLYLEKISGAKLPIFSESEVMKQLAPDVAQKTGAVIFIGQSTMTDAMKNKGVTIPTGVTKSLREEGYVVFCKGDSLVLAGNDTEPYYGTRYAVYDLLNRLGVRWFLPGDYGEIVPKLTTITVDDLNVSEKPDFAVRAFWTHSKDVAMNAERQLWMIRNRLNPRSAEWVGMPGDSSIQAYMPKEKLKDYPEWFALRRDGTRDPNMPCMTDDQRRNDPKYKDHPRIVDYFIERVKADAKAGKRVSAFAPDDGVPACFCDLCRKMNSGQDVGYGSETEGFDRSISQEWFYFVNNIIEGVNKEYPEHMVATNGYANRFMPPDLKNFNKSKSPGPHVRRHRRLHDPRLRRPEVLADAAAARVPETLVPALR